MAAGPTAAAAGNRKNANPQQPIRKEGKPVMLGKSLEDYLEAILVLNRENGKVRSIDVARYFNYSKPSVCHAVKRLQESGCLTMDEHNLLHLTEQGEKTAVQLYERRCYFTSQLIQSGVSPETARQDACRLEHILSDESFQAIRQSWITT